jgi:hypothetical protein
MKKSIYVIILITSIIILFAYSLYLHRNTFFIEGLTDAITQKTTNNSPTTNLIDYKTIIPKMLESIDTVTFINDPSNKNTAPRLSISNMNITLDGKPIDSNLIINNYLMDTNTIDIVLKNNSVSIIDYSTFPGKVVLKKSDNSPYTGVKFNDIINSLHKYFKGDIDNINVTRQPFNPIVNNKAPVVNKIKFNNTFKVTMNGQTPPIPFDAIMNSYLNDIDKIDITSKDLNKINKFMDSKTNVPIISTISLKN